MTLSNYKSFSGSENRFEFSPHINYLVGNNNAGKSTVLEAIDFVRNGTSETALIRSLNPVGDDYFVEITFAGNDITDLIDASDIVSTKAKTIKECLYTDAQNNEELLTVQRRFGENEDKDHDPKRILLREVCDGKPTFKNKTGIDAPFKSIFNPTQFLATDTPETILDFSSTHILGKIVTEETKEFFKSEEWTTFLSAHERAFGDEGYKNQLVSLQNELSNLTKEQFGKEVTVEFEFDTPEAASFVKMGKTHVNDGIANTELSEKGNGLQRAVAFALIRIYADQLRNASEDDSKPCPGLFLCVDEPETWMHPKAQLQLANALSTIAGKEQVWISTHSPYMLTNCNAGKDDAKLFVFNDIADNGSNHSDNRISTSQQLGIINVGKPSLGEITYRAFQIATPEYHNELFGVVQSRLNKPAIAKLDEVLADVKGEYRLEQKYLRLDSRYLGTIKEPIACETLPVHIRNLIDHPEAIEKKQECIDKFRIELKQKSYDGDYTLEDLQDQENKYTDEELEESIRMLEQVLNKILKTQSA